MSAAKKIRPAANSVMAVSVPRFAPIAPSLRSGPLQETLGRPGVDDPVLRHAGVQRALGSVAEEVQLTGGMGVGVDAEHAADLECQIQQPVRRIAAFRA